MSRAVSDVIVIGGGPAGAAAASLLARWGHAVALVTRPPAPGGSLGESIPPSTRKLFDVIGVRDRLEHAAFVRSTGNTVWWGSDSPRIELFAGGELGWQVTREAFAALLLEHAAAAGVHVTRDVVTRQDAVQCRQAAFVLDCTGRAGLFGRALGTRSYDTRFRTVALVGLWRGAKPFDLAEPTHTVIESYESGWSWSVPRTLTERFVALMVDPRRSTLPRDRSAADVYADQLQRTSHVSRLVRDAALIGGPIGWDASMYKAAAYVHDNVLLVGDAGSFVDPLSSAGIKKALASGWLAAIAVHTSLVRPAMRDAAIEFFAAREAEVYASFLGMTERFFADAAIGHAHPFWSDRTDPGPPPHAPKAELEAALDRLRNAPVLTVAMPTALRVEPRPAVSGSEIVLERRIVLDNADPGVRYAWDVDLLGLIDLAPAYTSVPDLFAAYNGRYAPVTWPDFLGALATALARRWLVGL